MSPGNERGHSEIIALSRGDGGGCAAWQCQLGGSLCVYSATLRQPPPHATRRIGFLGLNYGGASNVEIAIVEKYSLNAGWQPCGIETVGPGEVMV